MGLVAGDLLGRSFTAGVCVIRAWKKDNYYFSQISIKQFKTLGKKYIDFPKYILPDQLINSLGVSIPVLFIGAYFNNTEVGYYSMTMQILSIPISVVSRAVRDVFRQRANEDYIKYANCISIYKRLLVRITLIGAIATLAVIAILPAVFAFVLGDKWRIAGQSSQILLPMMTLNFIAMSLSGVFIVVRKMKISMYWQMYYTAITILSLVVGFFIFNTITATLLCFVIGRSSAYILYIFLSYKYSLGAK